MTRVSALAIALALALLPHSAAAGLVCYPLADIDRALDADDEETRLFSGREAAGTEYRLYVNARTGAWRWFGIPTGTEMACLIFAGGPKGEPSLTPAPGPSNESEAGF